MKTLEVVVDSMSSLPEYIQEDIFMKLPAKSILISRCVCKLWYNLLCSSEFIKYHLNYSIQDKNNHKLIFLNGFKMSRETPSIYSMDYASVSSSTLMPSSNRAIRKMDCPSKYNNGEFRTVGILGSCNGLVCLGIYGFETFSDNEYCICIWNPLTGEYKDIIVQVLRYYNSFRHGFGSDCNTETYKLVRIGSNKETGCIEILVYTLGSDSWNNIQLAVPYSFPCDYIYKNVSGLLFNGALHWLGSNTTQETSEIIVAFDMSTEIIADFPLPEDALGHRNGKLCHRSVTVLGDILCLLDVDGVGSLAEIWLMLEYGVRVSWTKRYSISLKTLDFEFDLKSILSFENVEILMANYKEFVLYGPMKKTLRSLNVDTTKDMPNKAENYVESLVSPNLGKKYE